MTLLAFGGLTRIGVLQYGEWYRLLASPFLHLDGWQMAMNAIALLLAGWRLESLIGRAWFGLLYAAGALGGSLMALAWNPPSVIAAGASGATMALLAGMLIASLHFSSAAVRTRLLVNSVLVLIASLVPLAVSLRDESVDYASHLGGAIAGVLVGLVMFKVWPRTEAQPGLRRAATAIAVTAALALAYPAVAVPRMYRAMSFITQLIPADQVPRSSAEMRSRATALVAQYPRDPRPRFLRTADMLDANDFAGAEREARIALADEDLWRPILSPQLGNTLRIMLAVAINGDRPEEARSVVRPACDAIKEGPMRKLLDDRKLCGNSAAQHRRLPSPTPPGRCTPRHESAEQCPPRHRSPGQGPPRRQPGGAGTGDHADREPARRSPGRGARSRAGAAARHRQGGFASASPARPASANPPPSTRSACS